MNPEPKCSAPQNFSGGQRLGNETIRIENGRVILVEERILKSVSVQAFRDQLTSSLGIKTPLLPSGCIQYAKKNERSCFLLEQAPAVRQIRYAGEDEEETHKIALPWVYFAVVFHNYALNDLFTFFAQHQVESPSSMLCYPPLPNISSNCKVCLGDYRYDVTATAPMRISDVLKFFWESQFNQDIVALFDGNMPTRIKDLAREGESYFAGWSRLPPSDATSVPWVKCWTAGEAVERVLSGS